MDPVFFMNIFNSFSRFACIISGKEEKGMKLLLIEDEKRMAQALCEILRQEDYQGGSL